MGETEKEGNVGTAGTGEGGQLQQLIRRSELRSLIKCLDHISRDENSQPESISAFLLQEQQHQEGNISTISNLLLVLQDLKYLNGVERIDKVGQSIRSKPIRSFVNKLIEAEKNLKSANNKIQTLQQQLFNDRNALSLKSEQAQNYLEQLRDQQQLNEEQRRINSEQQQQFEDRLIDLQKKVKMEEYSKLSEIRERMKKKEAQFKVQIQSAAAEIESNKCIQLKLVKQLSAKEEELKNLKEQRDII